MVQVDAPVSAGAGSGLRDRLSSMPLPSFRKASGESVQHDTAGSSDGVLWEGTSKTMTGVGGGKFRLTRRFLIFERGLLTSQSQQIPLESVKDVDVKQSLAQRARGVSDVILHCEPHGDRAETVVIESIPDAGKVRDLINDAVRARLHEIQDRERRVAMPQMMVGQMGGASSDDVLAQLERLGALRAQGVLTDDEFAAAKAKLISG